MPLSAIAARKARRDATQAGAAGPTTPAESARARPSPSPSPSPSLLADAAPFARALAHDPDQADEVDLVVDLTSDAEDEVEEPGAGVRGGAPAEQVSTPTTAPAGRKRGPVKDGGRYFAQRSPAATTPRSARAAKRTSTRSSKVGEDDASETDVQDREDARELDADLGFGFGFGLGASGSGMGVGDGANADESATPGRPRKKRRVEPSDAHARRVSAFTPVQDQNVVLVSAERIARALGGQAGGNVTTAARDVDRSSGESAIQAERAVVFSLRDGEDLIVSGTCTLTPLLGRLAVFSTHLEPTGATHRLFAPLTHPLPVLRPVGDAATPPAALLVALDLPPAMTAPGRTVVLVQRAQTGVERMDDALVGMGRVWPAVAGAGAGVGAFGLRGFFPMMAQHDRPVYPHETPASWRAALDALPSPEGMHGSPDGPDGHDEAAASHASMPYLALVRGPKRSGKSTFAREAVNALLNSYERVAYLDCDLGQSEFGCGGAVELHVVSRPLLGPNFTHPAKAVRSCFLGSLSPTLYAEAYLATIAALLEHYRFEIQYPVSSRPRADTAFYTAAAALAASKITEIVPLVVNTQGWVKGLGADLLLDIERMVQPTVVFDFAAAASGEVDGANGEWARSGDDSQGAGLAHSQETATRIISLSAVPTTPLLSKYTAAEFRILSMMSYLHSVATPQATSAGLSAIAQQWDYSTALVRQRPWRVDMQVIREIYLAGEGADAVVPDDLPLALNGAIVALAERIQPFSKELPDDTVYTTGRPLPQPDEVYCLGLAVIHSIAPDLSSANILTPISPRDLARASIVIKGELELPVMAMLDWNTGAADEDQGLLGTAWEDVPFLQIGPADGVGMGRRRYRRNVMRKGQMA